MATTTKGKEISKMNAVKHGLTGNTMISNEERAIFEDSKKNLSEYLKPDGLIEEMLISNIAFYFVKLQRSMNMESMQVIVEGMQNEINYKETITPEAEVSGSLEFTGFGTEVNDPKRNKLLKEIKGLKNQMAKMQSGMATVEGVENLTKIQRYHTAIENRLYKSINQFYEIRNNKNAINQ